MHRHLVLVLFFMSITTLVHAGDLHAKANPDGSFTFTIDETSTVMSPDRAFLFGMWMQRKTTEHRRYEIVPSAPSTPPVTPGKSCTFGEFVSGKC